MFDVARLTARTQAFLAFAYLLAFFLMFAALLFFWEKLSKIDVGLLTMFATGAMNQSKDAGSFFFARHRQETAPDPAPDPNPTSPPPVAAKTVPTP